MGRDNRLADGKPDADAVFLGGEESVEHPIEILRIDPRPVVTHEEADRALLVQRRADLDPPPPGITLADGLETIHKEIDDHLLKLDAVAHDARKAGSEIERQVDGARL